MNKKSQARFLVFVFVLVILSLGVLAISFNGNFSYFENEIGENKE
jgi:hypothetical protein